MGITSRISFLRESGLVPNVSPPKRSTHEGRHEGGTYRRQNHKRTSLASTKCEHVTVVNWLDGIQQISTFTLKKIWSEAREIVGSPGYVLPVAGSSCPLARQVYNAKQPSKPLVVTSHTKKSVPGYIFQCPACSQFAYLKLCFHTIATAEVNHVLKEYVGFVKDNTELPNLHQLSVKGSRKGAGW